MKKKEIRHIYKTKRRSASPDQLEAWSLAIFKQCQKHFDLTGKQVSIFLPIERLLEINTWHFLEELEANLETAVVQDNGLLKHIRYVDQSQIVVSEWGIPEPLSGEEIEVEVMDIVFVPLLVADMRGYRVGYGKGFYDSFLKKCPQKTKFIGLSYFPCIHEIKDVYEGDVPLHYLVTPEKIIDFKNPKK